MLLAQSEENATTGGGDDQALLLAYMEIAKQLVQLHDDLPQLTQCIVDVKAGTYQPSTASVIASGGKVEAVVDTATGQPVQILVKEEQILDPAQTITFTTDQDKKIEVTDASTAVVSDEKKPDQSTPEESKPATTETVKTEPVKEEAKPAETTPTDPKTADPKPAEKSEVV